MNHSFDGALLGGSNVIEQVYPISFVGYPSVAIFIVLPSIQDTIPNSRNMSSSPIGFNLGVFIDEDFTPKVIRVLW